MSRRAGTEREISVSTILWDVPQTIVTIIDPTNLHNESLPTFAETVHNIITGRNLSKTAILRNFLPEFRQTISEFPTSQGIVEELRAHPHNEVQRLETDSVHRNFWLAFRATENLYPHITEHVFLHIQYAIHRYNDTYVTDPQRRLRPVHTIPTTDYNIIWSRKAQEY